MSAEIQTYNADAAINPFSSQSAFESSQRMATALSKSTMVPKEYQGNLPNCMIALECAARMGAGAFAIMQNMDVIHGRPSFRASFLIATVNASGRFSPLRYRFEGTPGTPAYGCRAVAKDRESGEECQGALITLGMAEKEGWATKPGSKWKTMPEQMLMYRAAAFWTRVYAPELSMGMHTSEELSDSPAVPVQVTSGPTATAASLEAALLGTDRPSEPAHDSDGVLSDEETAARIERGEA